MRAPDGRSRRDRCRISVRRAEPRHLSAVALLSSWCSGARARTASTRESHLLNVAVPLLFSLMLVRVVVYVLRHAFGASGPLRYWERAIAWTIWIGLALHITGSAARARSCCSTSFAFYVGKQRISMLNVLQGLLAVAITVVIAVWAGRADRGALDGCARARPEPARGAVQADQDVAGHRWRSWSRCRPWVST